MLKLYILFNNNNKRENSSYTTIQQEAENDLERDQIAHDCAGSFVFLSPNQVFDIIYYIGPN